MYNMATKRQSRIVKNRFPQKIVKRNRLHIQSSYLQRLSTTKSRPICGRLSVPFGPRAYNNVSILNYVTNTDAPSLRLGHYSCGWLTLCRLYSRKHTQMHNMQALTYAACLHLCCESVCAYIMHSILRYYILHILYI
jgi:hypothetical protein